MSNPLKSAVAIANPLGADSGVLATSIHLMWPPHAVGAAVRDIAAAITDGAASVRDGAPEITDDASSVQDDGAS